MAICGIYKITNKINGKAYIGQSVNIKNRWQVHASTKDEYPIHRAIQKYSKKNFEWEILEECSSECLNEREQYYIALYNTCFSEGGYGYNITNGGEGGVKTPVNQYDKQGIFIRTYDSMAEAADDCDTTVSQIGQCCQKRCHSAGGYLWSYIGEKPMDYVPPGQGLAKKVDQYDLQGNFIKIFRSCQEAAKEVSLKHDKKVSKGQILNCCRKDNTSAGGYMWRFHGEEPPAPYVDRYYRIVKQYSIDDKLIAVYSSLKEAEEKTGVGRSNICTCIKGKARTGGGYKWK